MSDQIDRCLDYEDALFFIRVIHSSHVSGSDCITPNVDISMIVMVENDAFESTIVQYLTR